VAQVSSFAVSIITLVVDRSSDNTVALKSPLGVTTVMVDPPAPVGFGGTRVGMVVGVGEGIIVEVGEGRVGGWGAWGWVTTKKLMMPEMMATMRFRIGIYLTDLVEKIADKNAADGNQSSQDQHPNALAKFGNLGDGGIYHTQKKQSCQ